MIIIYAGCIGRWPIGGDAWAQMQHLLGLDGLGHEVFYLEECGEESWVYNWETEELITDLEYPTAYVRDCLEPIGFSDRWIYRAGDKSRGMRVSEFLDICSQADLLIVRGAPIVLWRPEYGWPRRRVFIDVDPGFTQIRLANGNPELSGTIARCERLFTIGQRLGAADCPIPTVSRNWLKTVSPISLPHWEAGDNSPATHFTSVMSWAGDREVMYEGITYLGKDKEFVRFIELPRLTSQTFKLAVTAGPLDTLSAWGWEVVPGWIVSRTPSLYRDFIRHSRAEFGVAAHCYVYTRGGWFSDRSVCYLASGRPILVQDTGLSDWLPVGEGILTFRDVGEALRGIETINSEYDRHRRAARRLAEEYFATERVLPHFLDAAMD